MRRMKYDITAQPAERLRYSIRRAAIKAQVVIAAAKLAMRQSTRDWQSLDLSAQKQESSRLNFRLNWELSLQTQRSLPSGCTAMILYIYIYIHTFATESEPVLHLDARSYIIQRSRSCRDVFRGQIPADWIVPGSFMKFRMPAEY